MQSVVDLFQACTERTEKAGDVEIRCKLGLWSVSGRDRLAVEREAMHYWRQYLADGEYAMIIQKG